MVKTVLRIRMDPVFLSHPDPVKNGSGLNLKGYGKWDRIRNTGLRFIHDKQLIQWM